MLLLVTFTCAGSVVAGISLRPVFADASDGIFHEGQEVSFAFELRNLEKDPVVEFLDRLFYVFEFQIGGSKGLPKLNSGTLAL